MSRGGDDTQRFAIAQQAPRQAAQNAKVKSRVTRRPRAEEVTTGQRNIG